MDNVRKRKANFLAQKPSRMTNGSVMCGFESSNIALSAEIKNRENRFEFTFSVFISK
jgi:hypothetical protein